MHVSSSVTHVIPRIATTPQGAVIGGSASSLVALLREQERTMPFPLQLVTGGAKDGRSLRTSLAGSTELVRLNMASTPVSMRYGAEFSVRAVLGSEKLKGTSLIHGHSGHWMYAATSRALAWRLQAPWIHTLYCPLPAGARASRTWPYLVSGAAALVGMSANVAASIVAAGVPAARVHHIDPCIDTTKFHPRGLRDTTRSALGIPDEARVILFVGNASHAKGFDVLLSAFRSLAPSWDDLYLVATLEEKGIAAGAPGDLRDIPDERVRWLGFVPNMNALMEAADALVLPFRTTQGPSDYPTAMLEAMALGTPVIASDVGGISEVIVHGETGMLTPVDDPPSLAAAIQTLLLGESAPEIAHNAQCVIEERFRPEVAGRRWRKLYETLAA